jgi:stalled ribosome rescue protein Dom34
MPAIFFTARVRADSIEMEQNMSAYVVWMDSTNAKIFHIAGDQVTAAKAFRHDRDHHTHNKMDAKQKDNPRFFTEVADHLKAANESVLLVGPGKSKNHFVSYLEDHHKRGLAQRIVGTEAMDHPTDGQIIAFARKYFPQGVL